MEFLFLCSSVLSSCSKVSNGCLELPFYKLHGHTVEDPVEASPVEPGVLTPASVVLWSLVAASGSRWLAPKVGKKNGFLIWSVKKKKKNDSFIFILEFSRFKRLLSVSTWL